MGPDSCDSITVQGDTPPVNKPASLALDTSVVCCSEGLWQAGQTNKQTKKIIFPVILFLASIHVRVLLVKESTPLKLTLTECRTLTVYSDPFVLVFVLIVFMMRNSFFGTHCLENPVPEILFNVSDPHSKPKSPEREYLSGHITQSECTLKRLLCISCVNTMPSATAENVC